MEPSNISWTAFDGSYKHATDVPYTLNASSLETVSLWLPSQSKSNAVLWLIYVHGGAWRDPLIRPDTSFSPTVKSMISTASPVLEKIAGFASIDYPLSWSPASPSDLPERNVQHPTHISAVINGLNYLAESFGASQYILVGHSCGAALALQTIMDLQALRASSPPLHTPLGIIGLNGLYDLPAIIEKPGEQHESLELVYRSFTTGAFTEDEAEWKTVSPRYDALESLKHVKFVLLAQSKQDGLVPYWQTAEMMMALRDKAFSRTKIEERVVTGDHNDVWRDGHELAILVEECVGWCL